MRLIVFGSTGGTGQELVKQALEQGHKVTAFGRNPAILPSAAGLTVIQGDVLNYPDVEQAVAGHDAVLCAIGKPSPMDKSQLRAKGTANIVKAMQATGVKRLVCQSSLGTGDSAALLPFHYKWLIVPLFMRHLFRDHALQEEAIRDRKLKWVIVRPGALTNGPRTSQYRTDCVGYSGLTPKVSRADVAEFMLRQADSDCHLNEALCIYY